MNHPNEICQSLDTNHMGLCRFRNAEDDNFKIVAAQLKHVGNIISEWILASHPHQPINLIHLESLPSSYV